jgi:8-oxo-dGTP diphosphatase
LGEKLDKRNFRKKVLALGLLKPLRRRSTGRHRPARLYRFAERQRVGAEIDKNAQMG